MNFDVLKQFNLNVLMPLHYREVFLIKGNDAALLTVFRYFNVCMHSDIYEPILLKLSIMKDSSKVHILILV